MVELFPRLTTQRPRSLGVVSPEGVVSVSRSTTRWWRSLSISIGRPGVPVGSEPGVVVRRSPSATRAERGDHSSLHPVGVALSDRRKAGAADRLPVLPGPVGGGRAVWLSSCGFHASLIVGSLSPPPRTI